MAALLRRRNHSQREAESKSETAATSANGSTVASQVTNFYELVPEDTKKQEQNPGIDRHHLKIPFRMLIVGTSGSMKTNTALDIIQKMADTFYSITLLCRAADEPLYKFLRSKVPKEQLKIIEIEKDNLSDFPTIESFDKSVPHLVIFDDLVLLKDQSVIEEFFIRCRKFNICVMYLAQSYFKTPKTIRINCNYILLKKIPSINDLKAILREYALGVSLDELEGMYNDCTSNPLHWLTISMDNPPDKRFYRAYDQIQKAAESRPIGSLTHDVSQTSDPTHAEATVSTEAEVPAKRPRKRAQANVNVPEFMRHLPPATIRAIQQRFGNPTGCS